LFAERATGDVFVDHDPTRPLGIATKQYADSIGIPPATSDIAFNVATTGDDIEAGSGISPIGIYAGTDNICVGTSAFVPTDRISNYLNIGNVALS
jgi:hypothetical protein